MENRTRASLILLLSLACIQGAELRPSGLSMAAVAEALTAEGVSMARGGRWAPRTCWPCLGRSRSIERTWRDLYRTGGDPW
jgi:hypothetical protein